MLLSLLGILVKAILILAGIFLVLLSAVLFVPVRYFFELDHSGKFDKSNKFEGIKLQLIVTWFFKVIKLEYMLISGKSKFELRFFGIGIMGLINRLVERKERRERAKKKAGEQSKQLPETLEKQEAPPEKPEELLEKPEKPEKSPETIVESTKQNDKSEIKQEPKPDKKKPDIAGIFAKIKDILNKVDTALKYKDRDEVIRYSILFVKRLFKVVKPKKLWIRGEIGFDDPSATGYLFAGIGAVYGITGMDIQLKGNFEESIQDVRLIVKGKLTFGLILWATIRYLLAKPIWKLVKKIIFGKGDTDGK